IRDKLVTGVQACALPISNTPGFSAGPARRAPVSIVACRMNKSERDALVQRYTQGYSVVVEALAGITPAELDARHDGWTAREVVRSEERRVGNGSRARAAS